MAWILSKAQCLKTGDETHAIFGNIAHQHVKGQITDSQSDHTEDKVTLAIKFVTPVPSTVWNREKKEWDHDQFKLWRLKLQTKLGLNAQIVGFARLRNAGSRILVSTSKSPISALDAKLCEFLSRTEGIITFLMAVSTQVDLKEDKRNVLTTDVTLGCFKAGAQKGDLEKGYVDLIVQNLGLPNNAVSSKSTNLFNPSVNRFLEKASLLSSQLRTQLENVHESYQRQLQPLASQSTLKMDEASPSKRIKLFEN